MNNKMKNTTRYILIALLVSLGIALRVLPHEWNMAPVAAIAAFAAFLFSTRTSIFVTAAILLVSDAVLGGYERGVMVAVYGSFFAMAFIGRWIRRSASFERVLAGSLAGSTLFFLTTNFAVWAFGAGYAKNAAGLLEAYTLAIPFFRNTILGDLGYSLVLFGAYALYRVLKPTLAGGHLKPKRIPIRKDLS